MSYQVLARKWRPQTFLEMAGQDHVLQALVNALRQQRLHHAYLFTGTRGVGKTTIARIFAKCLNCETNGISPEPCGTCDSCREIVEGRFVDLIEVDAASRTKVEDTRELLENVQYAPTRGRFKVYLIDEVHMLSTHSFNALLKTLEEPPEHVKFLLATTDPQKLPVTILSRCLQFNLKNMSPQRVVDYLQTVLNAESVTYDQPALWQIGQAANGSMRDALSLTDQAIAFGDGEISETSVTSMLGLVNQSQILSLLETVASKNAAETLVKINALADYQPDFYSICGSLLDTLHRVAIEQQVPGVLVDQMGDLARIKALAASVSAEEVQVMYQSLLIGRRDLPLSHAPKAGFEMLMLRLIAFRPAGAMTVSYEAPPASYSSDSMVPSSTPESVSNSPTEQALSKTEDEQKKTSDIQLGSYSDEPVQELENIKEAVVDLDHESTQLSNSSDLSPAAVPSTERPPWEDAPAEPEIDISEPSRAAFDLSVEVKDQEISEIDSAPSERLSKMLSEDSDLSEEESDEDADERAIAETEDPYRSAASLVEAVVEEDSEEASQSAAAKNIANTVTQPALGMPLPDIAHFKDMTMNLWWLVAPRLKLTGLVQNIAMNSSLVDASEQGIKLQVPLEYGHMLNQTRYEQIQSELSSFFSVSVPLIIDTVAEVDGVTAEEFAASKRAEALQSAINHLNAHPVVKALSDTLGGQVLYDTVKVKA
ncbi:DNA polymerase III subunit gamma/tau [Marinomonas piezotolerans]|uniref:DNA polymerase III subunit gamma/tau n=1 Tax=Marinomonas piezotolerans TaxID=2213058 RepID=A0A370UD39_9GAMM|nr:DNA polymerase III subunit gamma/tau [Marinomonas piezotolerans]RDL45710.1 DNA polymerase III subunit gamma/tau [Marinomonas piezotolerans]